jgi:predicted acetyltransferase
MDIDIRQAELADFDEMATLDGAAFGIDYTDEDIADTLATVDLSRFYVATEGSEIVGITGDFPFGMTLPGGAQLAVPGVSWVSVRPTHRRRGILRQLMRRQLSDFRARGDAMAILTASEGGIYRRFGYGAATVRPSIVLDRRLARLDPTLPGSELGAVRFVAAAQSRPSVAALHARWQAEHPGALTRDPAFWDNRFLDRPRHRHGMTGLQVLLHRDGYAMYRIKEDWADGRPQHTCVIVDFVWCTAEAHRALWQVLLGLDLVGSIESSELAPDDPVTELLSDPRQLRTTSLNDGLWVRLLDVPTALAARRYGCDVEVALQIIDPLADGAAADRTYLLRGGPDGAECRPTDRTADLTLPVDVLGSAYLGGKRLRRLAASPRVAVASEQALHRLDLAMLADRAPIHGTAF